MAYLHHQIGSFFFVNMSGNPETWGARTQRLEWPGMNGVRYRTVGFGSTPFNVDTYLDVASVDAGLTLLGTYRGLCGAGTQKFVYNNVAYDATPSTFGSTSTVMTAPGFGVKVLDVKQVELTNVAVISGRKALSSNNTIFRARWTLELDQL